MSRVGVAPHSDSDWGTPTPDPSPQGGGELTYGAKS